MILKVWDNEGETFDRYTVRIRNDFYGMSHNAQSPQGFNQYAGSYPEITEGKHLGKLIAIKDYKLLPESVRKAIMDRS